ncbi:MAG: TetR/AcrR family transcriptional regulator [Lachnospiraceae bacterium]|nr:TetR/AcrR family transcriptional regulator [Lachnospiraceae bacterium]
MAESKSAEERREEIMDAAAELFSTKGYEETTTTDIMKKVGIAKGTLYYHFASKEEILDAMIERMGRRLIATARDCAATDAPVYERLLKVMLSLNANSIGGEDLIEIMHQPRNVLMHEKSRAMVIREAGPILADLVREGVDEGLFDCKYPEQTVEIIMVYVLVAFDGADFLEADMQQERIDGFIAIIERMFGAGKGSFDFVRQLFK